MSEDRFKQARKSLIDRQNQRQFDDGEEFGDEATAMVNLSSFPPLNPEQGPGDEATEMFSIDAYGNPKPQATAGGVHTASNYGSPGSSQGLVVGQSYESEGATQFLNIADLAGGAPPASSDQNTQFVDINALQAGAGVSNEASVDNDPVLKQEYLYGPENIREEADITLIFAQNRMGRPVVLKRVWEGNVDSMHPEVRQRCLMLDQIKHPNLIGITGMLPTPTGAWVEMPMPTGYQLTNVLAQNGPQSPELVAQWATQIAQVLAFIHQFQFVYANLTTDSVWVQEDGSILLEPFDIIAFQDRGNLGPFGPPELNLPPQQRQVYPATDVYSLAAVTVAALAGLPLNLMVAPQLPPPFAGPCTQALQQDPSLRVPTPAEFAQALIAAPAKPKSKGIPPEHRMKVVIGAIAVLGVIVLGVASQMQQKPAPKPAGEGGEVVAVKTEDTKSTKGETEGKEPDEKIAPENLPEGLNIESDPRLTITTSYSKNPVEEDEDEAPEAQDPERADAARVAARDAIKNVPRLTKQSQQQQYTIALEKMTEAIRLSSLTEEDKEFLADLNEASTVQQIRKESVDQVRNAIKEDKVSAARLYYQTLGKIDPLANEQGFFNRNKSLRATVVKRTDAPSP